MPHCQANVENCETEEMTCGCGVIACTLHGHVDEAYWEGCPNLVEGVEEGEERPKIDFQKPVIYSETEIAEMLQETIEGVDPDGLVDLFNYKYKEQVIWIDSNQYIVKDPSQVKEQKELIQILFERSNFGPPAIIDILELVPTHKLQKLIEENYPDPEKNQTGFFVKH